MARFYHCSSCEREFLGPEDIPDDAEGVEPMCDRCWGSLHVCGICGDFFHPAIKAISPDGEPLMEDGDFCQPCYVREIVPIEEAIDLETDGSLEEEIDRMADLMEAWEAIMETGYWKVEVADTGSDSASENCLLMIHADAAANPQEIEACCGELATAPETKTVWVVFDDRCSPLQVQAILKLLRAALSEKTLILKHVTPLVISCIESLWREMQAYCERVQK